MTNFSSYQPALGLQRSIALQGGFPSREGNGVTTAVLGQIHTYAFGFQSGGVTAAGQTIQISSNFALFAILGTTYGGDGRSTFALPDLQGRISSDAYYSPGDRYGDDNFSLSAQALNTIASGGAVQLTNSEPYLETTFSINANGAFPSSQLWYDTIGVITQFAGNFAPDGTIPCDGRLLLINEYTALFTVLGTTYGGDGETTFAVPDLRAKTIVGVDNQHMLGQTYGTASQTVSLANLPVSMGGSGAAISTDFPSIVLHYIVTTQGLYPSRDTAGVPDDERPLTGEILLYAGSYLPDGLVDARGQTLSINQNQALFSLLGTTFGGDGITTFQLPNLGGRTVIGTGSGAGLVPIALGQVVGQDSIHLTNSDFGPLTVVGTAGNDVRGGGDQADALFGYGGNDTLNGNGGDDRLIGGAGADTLNGGSGTNTASYEDAVVGVVASLADPSHNTGDALGDSYNQIQNLLGSSLDDTLIGDFGNNVLNGGAGNDVLEGGAGADTLIGGTGINTASYDGASTGVTVNLATPAQNTGDAAGDSYQNIANLIGSTHNDVLTGDGNANTLSDNGGSDSLYGGGGDDRFVITGTPTLIDGGSGTADTIEVGGTTNFTPGAGSVTAVERIVAFDDAVVDLHNITGAFSVIRSFSTAGHSVTIHGTAGADMIASGAGADHLFGEGGNDTFSISNSATTIDGGIGTDTVNLNLSPGSTASYDSSTMTGIERVLVANGVSLDVSLVTGAVEIIVGAGTLGSTLTGTAQDNHIVGGGGADTLRGGAGDDNLNGGAGDDIINGGLGADTLTGGTGRDIFVFNSLAELKGSGTATDTILDFVSGQDKIDFSAIGDADGNAANGIQHFTFIGTNAFHKGGTDVEVNVRATANTSVFVVQFDTNHDGKADATFVVHADHAPVLGDFVFG